jgi:alkylation response protein AidB-like acyl-CoA dehydrogenase
MARTRFVLDELSGGPTVTRFAFTAEQQELRTVLRSLFDKKSSQHHVRIAMETPEGYDPTLWHQLAEQVGVQGLALPEEFGGAGYGDLELGVVMEEAGRALVCAPFLSTVVLAAKALLLSENSEAQEFYLPKIAAGELIATLAWSDATGPGAEVTRARATDDGWRIDGAKLFVLDGCSAKLLVVAAEAAGRTALFTVDVPADGLHAEAMTTMDLTRKQARLQLSDVPATLLVGPDLAAEVLARVLTEARVALAVEQVGGAEACLEMAVEYAKIREQFGRPIGSFQAIKHRCADMLVEVELAKSTAYNALWALAEEDKEDVVLAASMAKALCSEAYVFVATENIQVHGGIGFSWEHAAHLYFRRARSSAVMLGDANFHRELVARRLGV